MLGRQVGLVSRRGIESSRNYIRRKAILKSAQVVYGIRSCVYMLDMLEAAWIDGLYDH